jgi:hypothetical protein
MRSKKLLTLAVRCVVLNGFLFLGSLVLVDHVLAPAVVGRCNMKPVLSAWLQRLKL